MLCRIKI